MEGETDSEYFIFSEIFCENQLICDCQTENLDCVIFKLRPRGVFSKKTVFFQRRMPIEKKIIFERNSTNSLVEIVLQNLAPPQANI